MEETEKKSSSGDLLRPFCLLDSDKVQVEVVAFEAALREAKESWHEESAKYEESISVEIDGESMTVPRRNYANADSTVTDPALFPYDNCFYPLLNAYDCLYEDGDFHPIASNAHRPFHVPMAMRYPRDAPDPSVDGYMPATCSAIWASLLPGMLPDDAAEEAFFSWTAKFCAERTYYAPQTADLAESSPFVQDLDGDEKVGPSTTCPTSNCPLMRPLEAELLLKVLRHSMSDLQRDHRLSAAVMMRLTLDRALDNGAVMRELLATLDSQYVVCGFPCDEDLASRNHICQSWTFAMWDRLRELLSFGLTTMSEVHATALVAFVRSTFLREYGCLLPDNSDGVGFEKKRKTLLKRTIVSLRAEEAEDMPEKGGGGVPDLIVGAVVSALGIRVSFERRRLQEIRENRSIDTDAIQETLSSYSNCVLALVEIGRLVLLLLPGSERFYPIASDLVKSLAMAYMDMTFELPGYVGRYRDDRLVAPLRYSSSLTRQHARKPQASGETLRQNSAVGLVGRVLSEQPPSAVIQVVKYLFLRDLVDHRVSGMGYGDFLLWCGLEISALDPLLFWPEYAYPDEESDSEVEDDDENEEDDEIQWDLDDQGEDYMGKKELKACHDFTLLALVRAWNAPWHPESHVSYQPEFRGALTTLGLCSRRCGMPNEVFLGIASYLKRDWWPDSRMQCWSYECQVEQLRKEFRRWLVEHNGGSGAKRSNSNSGNFEACPHCGVARYCSKECREHDYKAGHKKVCCRPPFRSNDDGDAIFLKEVLGEELPLLLADSRDDNISNVQETTEIEDVEVDGDDGSWESFDSDQEGSLDPTSRSTMIQQYFAKHAYGRQR